MAHLRQAIRPMSEASSLQIASAKGAPPLTPAQKRFNTLIRQIEQARQTLAAWQENIPIYRQAHAGRLLPLRAELLAASRQWVFALDGLLGQPGWSKAERATLGELLCEAAGQLLAARGDDAELKALFDRHAEVDFDTGQREAARAMKDLTEALTGLDLGDDEEIHTEDDVFARIHEGLDQQAAEREAARGERAARRRKSAAEQRREAEVQQAAQSMREIFRKLASALHPDREPDEGQRRAKTALMQRVNQAYAANDLLALLELQLQVEQIDASHIANAGASRLKHYNKVLDEQLDELRLEIHRLEMEWRMEFGVDPLGAVQPHKLHSVLEHTRSQWRAELAQMQRDTRMLADTAVTRRWLKRQRQRMREEDFDLPF
jgi:hypothetical protein